MSLMDLLRLWRDRRPDRLRRTIAPMPDHPDCRCISLEQHRLDQFLDYLDSHRRRLSALDRLLQMYRPPRTFPDLSHFRVGPGLFDRIPLDWTLFVSRQPMMALSELVGHAIAARLRWSGELGDLPPGWQGVVRRCYENVTVDRVRPNTLV